MGLNSYGLGLKFTATDAASSAIMGIGKNLGLLEKSAQDVNQAFDKTAGRTRDLATGRFVKAPEGLLNKQFLGEVSGQIKSIGIAASALSATITGGMLYAIHTANAYSAAIAEVSTLTDEASFATKDMEKLTMSLADTFGQDATQQAKGLYQTISAGIGDVEGATKLMTEANKLAIGGVTDTFTAVDALTSALNTFAKDSLTAQQASDAMFVAIKAGKTTASELGATLGLVGATAASLNINFDQLTGAIAAITTKGIKTSEAVTGLKAALANIIKPTSDAVKEAGRLGIKFDAATLRAKGLPAFLDSITHSAKFNADSFSKLFGSIEGLNAIMALTSNDSKTFNDILGQMAKKSGAANTAFEKMSNTATFQSNLLKSRFNNALITIGKTLEPLVVHVLKFANTIVVGFNKASPFFKKLAVYAGVAVAAISGLIGALAGSAVAIGGLILMGKALLVALGVVAAGFAVVAAAALPVIALGAAMYVAWKNNLGGIQNTVTVWAEKITLAFKAIGQALSDGAFSGDVQAELSKAENGGVKQFAINVFKWVSRIKNFFMGMWDGFQTGMKKVEPVIEAITHAFQNLMDHISPVKEAASASKETFEKFGAAGNKTGGMIAKVIDVIAKGVLGAIKFIDGMVTMWQKMKPVVDALFDAFGNLWNALKPLFAALGPGGTGDISVQNIADAFLMFGQAMAFGAGILVGVVTTAINIVAGIFEFVGGIIDAVRTVFAGLVEHVVLGVRLISAIFTGQWGKAWDIAKQMVENWANTIVQMVAKVVGGIAGMIDKLGKIFGASLNLKGSVEGFVQKITTGQASGGAALPAPAGAGAQPGVAAAQTQAEGQAAIANAAAGAKAPPVEVTVKSQLTLDGQQIHEATQKASTNGSTRSFEGPAPTP